MNIAEFEGLTDSEKEEVLGKIKVSDRATCEICHTRYWKEYTNRTADNKQFCICDDCVFECAAGPFNSDLITRTRTFEIDSTDLDSAKLAMARAASIVKSNHEELEHPVRRAMFHMFFDGMRRKT